MSRLTTHVLCEVMRATPGAIDTVRDVLSAELAVLSDDLALDVDFAVETREVTDPLAATTRRTSQKSGMRLRLHIDGSPLDWYREPADLESGVSTMLRANVDALVTPEFADHTWEAAGGVPVSPPSFVTLVKQLVQHGIRPQRVASAVRSWADADPLRVFEDALGDVSRRLRVRVHPDRLAEIAPAFAPTVGGPFAMMVDGIFYELGFVSGEAELVADAAMPRDRMRIQINDLRSPMRLVLAPDEIVVNATVPDLAPLGVSGGRPITNPANGNEFAVVPREFTSKCEAAKKTTWNPGTWAILTLSAEVKVSAPAVLSLDSVRFQMNKLRTAFPYLASHVEKGIGLERFARVLRHLLREEISIRDLRSIIDALATAPPGPADVDFGRFIVFASTYTCAAPEIVCGPDVPDPEAARLGEGVRSALKRYISHKYTRGQNTLIVYLLDRSIEERLRLRRPFSAVERRRLLQGIDNAIGDHSGTPTPCLLTGMDTRIRLRGESQARFPGPVVVSYQELSPDMNIQPLARIETDDDAPSEALDDIDAAMSELRYDDAQDLVGAALATEPPWASRRLAELLFVWNESGRIARVTENLDMWLRGSLIADAARADLAALRARPEHPSVRQWLRAREPRSFRRLQARYLPTLADLVRVPGGQFLMGNDAGPAHSLPVHEVQLDDFFIGAFPVTARQFALYLLATNQPVPEAWVSADDAARGVRWRDAIDYCSWLTHRAGLTPPVYREEGGATVADHESGGFRLPTEAEWEYAAGGGARGPEYRFAGSDRLADVGDVLGTEPVGMRRPNRLGLYDMSGGRAEWCWDWYAADYYAHSPARNPMGPPAGASRVCRGGDVAGAGDVAACAVTARDGTGQQVEAYRSMNLGFRLARSAR